MKYFYINLSFIVENFELSFYEVMSSSLSNGNFIILNDL